jgi:hypothetical protein
MTELNERLKKIPMPARMKSLPINEQGFPVPWFAADDSSARRFVYSLQRHLCWICGERLGSYLCFTIDPVVTVNRIAAEPPEHRECAEYGARAWHHNSVKALWITRSYHVNFNRLITLGDPEEVAWWAYGQPATRVQVMNALDAQLPRLRDIAKQENKAAMDELEGAIIRAVDYLPPPSKLTPEEDQADREDRWRANLSEPW